MAYCTINDVYLEAGSSVGEATDADVAALIDKSDKEINGWLTSIYGVVIPVSDDNLSQASVYLTIAKLINRMSIELSRPNSLNLGGDISFSVNSLAEVKALEEKAKASAKLYADEADIVSGSSTGIIIVPNPDDPYLDIREELL